MSWHCHHTFKCEPATTLSGVSSPFLHESHSVAMAGKSEARALVIETFRLLQKGQPEPSRVRLHNCACHSWSSASGHCHQYCSFDPATTSSGVTVPFLIGCHCA